MRRLSLAFAAAALLSLGCNNGAPPNPGVPPGAGINGACDAQTECRKGLVCDASSMKCVAGNSIDDGQSCTIGAECKSGLCGPGGVRGKCGPAGSGTLGATCEGDADCAGGFKCAFDGATLFPSCQPSGPGDVGVECALNKDCAQGLYCKEGKCGTTALEGSMAPKGYPPVLPTATPPWAGAKCPAEKDTGLTAYWELPRAGDADEVKEDFYRLPYPNDARRDESGKVDFSRHPKDPAPPFGFDALGRYLAALEKEPFGNAGTVVMRFDGPVDFDSLKADGVLRSVNLTSGPQFGQGRGLFFFISGGRNRYVCGNWLGVRNLDGDPLTAGTHAVILLKGVKDTKGAEIAPSPDLVALLGPAAPADAARARAHAAYAPLRQYLAMQNIPASSVLNATVFTVGDATTLMQKVAKGVAAAEAPTAESWVKCGGSTPSPCASPDGGVERACGTDPNFDEWHSRLELPIFQAGTPPYLSPAEGGGIDASGAAVAPVRKEKVCAALTVPKGTPPANGWPVVLYAHGTGGNFRLHAVDGAGLSLAQAALPQGTPGVAVLGFDQVGHGPRRGARQDVRPDDVVFNFGNPASARGTMVQGAADLHAVTRLLQGWKAAPPAELPALDLGHLAFWGHSQGATEGALFLATDSTVDGALLTGASANLTNAMLSKEAPVNIKAAIWLAVSEESPDRVNEFHPVLSLLQQWSDPADPLHAARAAVTRPAVAGGLGAYAHHLFQQWGKDDKFTAQPVQSVFARAAGLTWVGSKEDTFVGGPDPVANVTGNVVMPRSVTAAMRQYAPPSGVDGHFVGFRNETAKKDGARFLLRVLHGEVPIVPEP